MMRSRMLAAALRMGDGRAASTQPLSLAQPEGLGMSGERLERIGQVLRAEIAQGRLPGAVIAIARRGELVYYESFGFLDKQAGLPMPKDALFNIASMTKPLTTVGALILYEEGQILLNDPVARYLPQLAGMPVAVMSADGLKLQGTEPARRSATLQDLMRHTAGVTYGNRGASELHRRYDALNPDQMTGEAFLAKLAELPLFYQPGTNWDYSLGLDVLGLVIERVTQQSLGEYLAERLFKPLGMLDTAFMVPEQKLGRYAQAFPIDPLTGDAQSVTDRTKTPLMECGGGGVISTAADYLRFAQMLLDKGIFDHRRILGRKTVEFMTANQLGPEVAIEQLRQYPNINGYGYGLGVAVRHATGVAGIMGSPGDFNWGGVNGTYFWVDPQEELAVVFMAAAPGELRLRNRQLITALALQAIVD